MTVPWRGGALIARDVRQRTGAPSGTVSVGIPQGLGLLISVPLIATMFAEYPSVRIAVTEVVSGDILTWLESDRLDLGCVYEPHDSATFILEPLLIEELFLVTARDNWEGGFGPDGVALNTVKARDLAAYPLVMTGHQAYGTRGLQGKVARSHGIDLNVIATIDSLAQIVKMVARASAFAVLPHGAVPEKVVRGHLGLVCIEDPVLHCAACLARKRSRPVTRAVDIVQDTIRTIVRELVERHGIEGTLPRTE